MWVTEPYLLRACVEAECVKIGSAAQEQFPFFAEVHGKEYKEEVESGTALQ